MAISREYVFFTQDKTYCIPSGTTIDKIDTKKKKLYGILSGLSVVPLSFSLGTSVEEMKSHARKIIDFTDFILLHKELPEEIVALAINRELAESLFNSYKLSYFISADFMLINAYYELLTKRGNSIIGYLDPINGIISYMMLGNGRVQQFIQRKAIFGIESLSGNEIVAKAETEIGHIAKIESDRIGENIPYIIAGINEEYDKIVESILSTPSYEALHTVLVDKKTVLYKKMALAGVVAGVVFDLLFFPRYFSIKRQNTIMSEKIMRVQNYISKEDMAIKSLYKEKGKTIILQDKIDLKRLSKILAGVSMMPPTKIIYSTTKNSVIVDMYYMNNNILAQKYYYQLKKNKKIQVSLFINPTFNMSQIHIVIPKEVVG